MVRGDAVLSADPPLFVRAEGTLLCAVCSGPERGGSHQYQNHVLSLNNHGCTKGSARPFYPPRGIVVAATSTQGR
jgi:hypothetical protein